MSIITNETRIFRRFDLHAFLHFLGRGLYSIFVPILVLKNGYSLTYAFLFLISVFVVMLTTTVANTRLVRFKKIFYFNVLATLAELGLIIFFSVNSPQPLVFIALFICEGLYYAFYYVAYRSIMIHNTSAAHVVTNMGNLAIAAQFASLLAPFVGALLLTAGKPFLLLTAALFILVSLWPLVSIVNRPLDIDTHPKIAIKTVMRSLLAYGFLRALEINLFWIWAIYVYLDGLSLAFISLIPVSTAAATILVVSGLKRIIIKPFWWRLAVAVGALIIILVSVWRFFAGSFLTLTNFAASVGFLLALVPLETRLYSSFRGHDIYHAAGLMEIVAGIGALAVLLLAFTIGLKAALLAPIILAPLMLFLAWKSGIANDGGK